MIVVVTKSDLEQRLAPEDIGEIAGPAPVFRVSAITGEGCGDLAREIADRCRGDYDDGEGFAFNARQLDALARACSGLDRALGLGAAPAPPSTRRSSRSASRSTPSGRSPASASATRCSSGSSAVLRREVGEGMETGLRDLLVGGAGALGLPLTDEAAGRFSTYLDLIQTWGARINLTSRLDSRDIVIYHFLDSLSGARWLDGSPGVRIIDIGTGAGMPAIPLKIVRPDLEVIMIDGTRKKALFCQEAIKELGYRGGGALGEGGGAGPEAGAPRALPLGGLSGGWAARRDRLARDALPRRNGSLAALKGKPEQKELDALAAFCRRKHAVMESHPVEVPHLVGARTHLIVRRIA